MKRLLPILLALLVLSCPQKNRAPEVTMLEGPDVFYPDSLYTFSATASDIDGDKCRIRFAWGDGDTSDWSGWLTPAETAFASHRWGEVGTLNVCAQATDPEFALSDWFDTVDVVVEDPPGTPLWVVTLGNEGVKAVLVTDNIVYVASTTGLGSFLRAFGLDGTQLWEIQNVAASPSRACVAEPDGSTYTQWVMYPNSQWLTGVDPDGNETWRLHVDSYLVGLAQAGNSDLIAASRDGTVYRLNTAGTVLWTVSLADTLEDGPTVGADGAIYVCGPQECWALNGDGTARWHTDEFDEGSALGAPSIGPNGTLYFAPDVKRVYALNPDGTRRWERLVDGDVEAEPVVGPNGHVYVGSHDTYLYSFTADGELRWKTQPGLSIWVPGAVTEDSTLYISDDEGRLFAYSLEGHLKWRTADNLADIPLAIGADGTLYVSSGLGLTAVKGNSPPAAGVWSQYRHDARHTGQAD